MKAPDVVLRSVLVGNASFTALAGTRIHPLMVPAGTALPWVVYRRLGITREQGLGGPIGAPKVRIEYTAVGATYAAARTLADAMRAILDGYNGTSDNTTVNNVSLDDEADDLAQLDGAEFPNAFAVRQTYEVIYQEP